MTAISVFPHPVVIGHRGASGYRPEHSAAAYELAFEQGADFVEPDLVVTRDGVLVIRHENEISGTTDVADHPEFASRRATRCVDGVTQQGWFTEDFTWAELQTLRARERLPALRPFSAAFDGEFPVMRLADLFALVDRVSDARQRSLGIVAELKHASYFARLGFAIDELFAREVAAAGWGEAGAAGLLVVESFEPTVLARLRARGSGLRLVQLVEDSGSPADLVAELGSRAPLYSSYLTRAGLRGLAHAGIDGVSVPKGLLLDAAGCELVENAHSAGLEVFTWTLRPENEFLAAGFRTAAGPAERGDWRAEWAAIIASGVDGVFADHPDSAVDAREAVGAGAGLSVDAGRGSGARLSVGGVA